MSDTRPRDIYWIAQRHGQDWNDPEVLSAVDWLTSLVPSSEWDQRASRVSSQFHAAKGEWTLGRRVPLSDPSDKIAWYLFLARCYGDSSLRSDFFEPDGYRIAPLFRRIGQLLPDLREISGAEERAARLMTAGREQPDDGIFELLVAGTYKRRGWSSVEFVTERPGVEQTPDFYVKRGRAKWAIECKRAGRSGYALEERNSGEQMASQAHELSRTAGRSIVISVNYTSELVSLSQNYLVDKANCFLDGDGVLEWEDEGGSGMICDVSWGNLSGVLQQDDVLFGSSRMFELLAGRYDPRIDFTMMGDWTPAEGRPFHATSVDHVSLVAWVSTSADAARRKAQHFRGIVGRASQQLPGDRPGAIHVGYEAVGGNSADELRHRLNRQQMCSFDARSSRLRWVYGNYFTPERTTARMESAAVSETTAYYPVSTVRARQPLAGHLLFMDEDGRPGTHF